jgi:hypothetical protein
VQTETPAGPRGPHVVVAGIPYSAMLSTAEAARLMGCSVELLKHNHGTDRLPVRPVRYGRNLRWPTVAIAQAMCLPVEVPGGEACPDAQVVNPPDREPDPA